MDEGFVIAVKEKMEQDGVSTKELADRCGYVEEVILRVLDRNITLKLETAAVIAAALGMSLDAVCGILVKRELSDEEIEAAFRIQQHRYRREDAANMLKDMYEWEQISEEQWKQGNEMLDEIVQRYEDTIECNVDENTLWRNACEYVLKGVSDGR